MPNDHIAALRALIARAEEADDETTRAAALAEAQRVGAEALWESVSKARDRGVPWRTLASELRMAAATLHHQFTSRGAVLPRIDQPPRRQPLPALLDRFIGRQRELAELRRLLPRARVMTLTGTGGIGKTRLAGEFVHRAAEEFHAVWWVELAPVTPQSDSGVVSAAITAALDGDPVEVVAETCWTGPALLVLDNCEHLIDACAELVPRLLAVSDDLRVLATSREPLGTSGEQVFKVTPLSTDPAVQLFTERARTAAHGFELTGDLAGIVADLCERLDGLPLAIELAARQVTVLPPAELVACLDERLTLLAGSPRVAPARHQSLQAAIEWSYDLLSDTERAVFRRLTIFPDSFDRGDAAAVCADLDLPGSALWTVLTGLVAKSLVVADSDRLRVLESLRLFGHTRLMEHDEWTATADRLVDRLSVFTYKLPPDDMTRQERHVKRTRHRHNLEYAVTLASSDDDERYANLVATLVMARRSQLTFHGSRELLEDALARQRTTAGRVTLLLELCDTMVNCGDFTAGRRAGEEAMALARSPWSRHWALQTLVFACGRLGDRDAMTTLLPQLVASARELGDPILLAEASSHASWDLMLRGRLDEADAVVDEGLAAFRTVPAHAALGDLLHNAGAIALLRGDPERAAAHFAVVLAKGSFLSVVDALEGMGIVAARTGQPVRALRLLAAGAAARENGGSIGEPWWSGLCSATVAAARAELPQAAADDAAAVGSAWSLDEAVACALDDTDTPSVLTPREWEVALLVADGLTNREIAARQGVSARTVSSHLENIRAKLDLPTRAHIATWVTRYRMESSTIRSR